MKILSILFAVLLLFASNGAFAAQLSYGKYFGTMQMDGQKDAIAVSLDAFVTQIKDPTVYPALDVILRVNLGGYSSSEYVGYHFYDPTFNFEKGILQLNDPADDLTASLQVINTETEVILEGPVTHRLTNAKGKMRVVMNLEDGAENAQPAENLLSVLKGDYRGKCGSDSANLQLETARGLGVTVPGNALSGYSITGRFGLTNGPNCDGKKDKFCSLYPFSTGSYSPFTGKLKLQGALGSLDCDKTGDNLKCAVMGYQKSGSCEFSKAASQASPSAQIPASIFLNTTPEQMAPLPSPQPPDNEKLVNSLAGNFYGFLHFENRDEYQLMEMNVVASTSTENPHIQNQVMVEPTILLRLGSSWDSAPALSLFFPQRVFWLNTGFAFQADTSDYFAVIGDWRSGYVSGILYSRSFGRVGTFEMQKGAPPSVPSQMVVISSPTGRFQGPKDTKGPTKDKWLLEIEIPSQTGNSLQGGVPLLGRYSGPGQMTTFASASLDLNTGALGFLVKKPAGDLLVTGEMSSGGKLKLLWPVGPALGAPMDDYRLYTYWPAKSN